MLVRGSLRRGCIGAKVLHRSPECGRSQKRIGDPIVQCRGPFRVTAPRRLETVPAGFGQREKPA